MERRRRRHRSPSSRRRAKLLRLIRNIVLVIVIILLVIGGAVAGVVTYTTRRMLPQVDGALTVAGLDGPVTIYRDSLGVPQIYASTTHDLFFAQGYIQSQDRWWQMEFNRHTALGRISELTGSNASALQADIFIRMSGWNRAAQADIDALGSESRAVLDDFSSGVNAYITGKSGPDLAVEYSLLAVNGVTIPIEPWKPIDSVAWSKAISWSLGGNLDQELERTTLYQKLAKSVVANFYYPPYPYDAHVPVIQASQIPDLPPQTVIDAAASQPVIAPGTDLSRVQTTLAGGVSPDVLGKESGVGSNNWVISGKLTQSGKPILANDPHLDIQMPSIWYEMGLHCVQVSDTCPYDVEGFTFPGAPGVIIGHNSRIAWGVTNVEADVQDLYTIQLAPNSDSKYVVDGKTLDMQVVSETIHFGDKTPPKDIRVRLTRFGPIITDSAAYAKYNEQPLALHWTAIMQGSDTLAPWLGIDTASDWGSFRQALSTIVAPTQNFVYADVDGNIGYQVPGLLPIRANGHSGLTPVDGSTTHYDWKGYIPFDYLPRLYNPDRGYIDSANNAVIDPSYYAKLAQALGDQFGKDSNYQISQDWDYGYRSQRIADLIKATPKHSIDSVAQMQADVYSGPAADLVPAVLKLNFGDSVPQAVLEWMGQWDFNESANSGQAALYETFWDRLARKLWADNSGEVPDGSNIWWGVHLLLAQPNNSLWDDITTTGVTETRDDILRQSFADAYQGLVAQFGSDYSKWKWSDLHKATFVSSPLGQSGIGPIESLVNAGPIGVAGGAATLDRSAWSTDDPYNVTNISSMRMIVDLSDLNNSRWITTTGESRNPASSHYRDMIDLWRNVEYSPMLFDQDRIKQAASSTLTLQPK